MPVLVALVGLVVTVAATVQIGLMIEGRDERRFEAWVERTHANAQDRMQARIARLQTLTIGLLGGDEGTFSNWFLQHTQRFIEEDPSVYAIGVAVENSAESQFADPDQDDAAPASPDKPQDDFTSVHFQQSRFAPGVTLRRVDFADQPEMRDAMARAMQAREPVTSGVVHPADADAEAGGESSMTVIFIPVHFDEDIAEEPLDSGRFRGCVYAMVDAAATWEAALNDSDRLVATVYAGRAEDRGKPLWTQAPAEAGGQARFQAMREITTAGRTYTLVFESSPAFEAASLRWPVGLGTLAIGLLLTAGLTFLVHSQTRAWQAASRLSGELQDSQRQLEQINQTLEQRVADRTAVAAQRAAQLQRLAWQLTQAEQRERRRLARVLHDHLQQLLVAAKLHASQAQQALGDRSAEQVDTLLREAIEVSRSLTVELSPPVLHSSGFVAAVEWLGRQSDQKHQLEVRVHADDSCRDQLDAEMDDKVRVFLFEAVRELLFNVAKYAEVDQVDVRIEWLSETRDVRVVVIDEGVGFDPASRPSDDGEAGGFGLFSVQERLQLLGGTMTIDSQPGRGTRVTLTVPAGRPEVSPAPPASEREPLPRST